MSGWFANWSGYLHDRDLVLRLRNRADLLVTTSGDAILIADLRAAADRIATLNAELPRGTVQPGGAG